MGYASLSHWVIVGIVVLILFGRGRVSETMADFGKGITSFRRGLSENSDDTPSIDVGSRRTPDADQANER